MIDTGETAAWGPAIPLGSHQAQALLRTVECRVIEADLTRARRLVAARDATIEVLRLDTPAARTPRTRSALSAFRWTSRPSGDAEPALVEQLAGSGLFLSGWYAARNRDVMDGGDPWGHFVATGLTAGLAPNPFFDPAWYADIYLDGRRDDPAILHYLLTGARYALSPGSLFDAAAYLNAAPELAGEPDALAHFLTRGIDEGRTAIPVIS